MWYWICQIVSHILNSYPVKLNNYNSLDYCLKKLSPLYHLTHTIQLCCGIVTWLLDLYLFQLTVTSTIFLPFLIIFLVWDLEICRAQCKLFYYIKSYNYLRKKLCDGSNQCITYRSSRLSSPEKTFGVAFLIKFPVNFLKECKNEHKYTKKWMSFIHPRHPVHVLLSFDR